MPIGWEERMRNGVGLVAGALLLAGCEQPSETGRTADRNAEVVAAPQYGDEIASLAAKPEIATAMDSIQARNRLKLPMNTMSEIAPMVQKFVRLAVAPNRMPSPSPQRATRLLRGNSSITESLVR